jgi:hypothetical protein
VTVAEAIRERLLSLSAVTDLVGTRIRTLVLGQSDTLPAIRVQRITDNEGMHLRGSDGVRRSRVQVDSYANAASGTDPYATARNVDEALHGDGAGSGLFGFKGDIGSPPFTVQAIFPITVREEFDAEERHIVRVLREYEVWHTG